MEIILLWWERVCWLAENKSQLAKRLTPEFLTQSLAAFHRGELDALTAAGLLEISRAHLFRLRRAWLRQPAAFSLRASGGDPHAAWPLEVQRFLKAFLPLQRPPNYQLVADELVARFAFHRDRKSVAAHARAHFPLLVRALEPVAQPRRRWERARVGELWPHDSSIHQWWPGDTKQTLLLTVDDHARRYLAGTFVPTDTTWHHFEHFRGAFLREGRPLALYTDGLALFGHQSSADGRDPRSEFQRALTALGISHRVAPSPPAKGKIERRFGTLQNRTVCRTTGLAPDDAWAKALAEQRNVLRPAPAARRLDLHLARYFGRRRKADHQLDFLGRSWPVAPTARHTVTLIHHPGRQFWVVSQPPKPPENRWPDILAKFSL